MTSTAHTRVLDALTSAGCRVSNGGRASTCPAHDDTAPSLSIGQRRDGDGVLLRCHAGCDIDAILTALDLDTRDLFDEPRERQPAPAAPPRIVATYPYTDEAGVLLFEKVRMEPKTFRQRRPNGAGWSWSLGETRRVLYRLPAVVAAVAAGERVWLAEGEKDADSLAAAGVTATTWTEGAWQPGVTPKWKPAYTKALAGAHVVIVRDRDEPGRHTAATIAAELEQVAASVLILEPAHGKDATDHLAAGRTLDELVPVDLDGIPELPDSDMPELPDADELPGASWGRIDLADTVAGVLAGTIERPAPSVGRLDDGRALFYRGRVNGIAGASGSGKTWTALVACAQELAAGQAVAFIDLEDDAAGIVARLLDLGADPAAVVARFVYVQPGEGYGPAARERIGAVLDELRPTVAVVDSTGEAMALDGAKPNDDDDTARWFRKLPRWLARRTGAAVIVLDHVVKTDEGGLWPIGSQRKRAAISGAQYMQLTVRAFDKATPGRAKLVCAKDRAGNYRAGQRVADLDAEPGRAPLLALTAPPEAPQGSGGDWRPTALMERISSALDEAGEPLSFRGLDERVKGKAEHLRTALRQLVTEGHVTVTDGPRNAKLHTLVRRYEQRTDPRSDLYRPPAEDTEDTEDAGHTQPRPDRVSVSVSLDRDTGHTHSTVSGTHSGHTGTHSLNGTPDDLDDRPQCATCPQRLGRHEADAGICWRCRNIAARSGASR